MHFLLRAYNYSPSTYFLYRYSSPTPYHFTRPPYTARDALPEPQRASRDTSLSYKIFPNSPFKAVAKHEKPDAEEAIPEAVGKLFLDSIEKQSFLHYYQAIPSNLYDFLAAFLISLSTFLILFPTYTFFPFSINSSSWILLVKLQVVIVERSQVLRVMPRESLMGRISASWNLPQYLTNAILGAE